METVIITKQLGSSYWPKVLVFLPTYFEGQGLLYVQYMSCVHTHEVTYPYMYVPVASGKISLSDQWGLHTAHVAHDNL